METWQCTECGYVHEGKKPPRICPECEAPSLAFDLLEEEGEEWEEEEWDEEEWDDEWDEDLDDDLDTDWDE